MEEYFKFHNISELENMMINLQNEGQETVWNMIEEEKNALTRCAKRKLYWKALEKIMKEK